MNISDFKNFHRLLCERFNYPHDEESWWRDQVSLIEHIAKERDALKAELETARKQKPVGWYNEEAGTTTVFNAKFLRSSPPEGCVPVYASPVPAQQEEALEVLSSAIDTLKTVADNCEWSHSDFPVIARAEKLLQETPCTE